MLSFIEDASKTKTSISSKGVKGSNKNIPYQLYPQLKQTTNYYH
jgi:hypothetical protein